MSPRYPRFDELLQQMKQTHDAKGKDYEGGGRPYENLREGEEWDVAPWKMAMMRVGEKMRRVKSFASSGQLQNESIFDSLLDIAILSIIAHVLLEEEQAKTPSANSPEPLPSHAYQLATWAEQSSQPLDSNSRGQNSQHSTCLPDEFLYRSSPLAIRHGRAE